MFINTVVLAGNLVANPELRTTPGGTSVTDLRLAVNEHWTDSEGNKQEKAHFFDVTVWGKQAESVCRFLGKGDLIAVEGSLRQDTWTDKESGKNRSRVVVTAERIQFGPKRSKGNPGSDAAADEEAAKREAARKQFENNEGRTPDGDKPPF